MPAGRPPKPRATKKAQGTLRSERDKLPPVIGRIGAPPKPELTDDAGKIWDSLVNDLLDSGSLQSVDTVMLAMFCEAAATAQRLRPALLNPIYKKQSGNMGVSPAFTVWKEAVGVARQLAEQFGLTPSARARLGMENVGQKPGEAILKELGESPRRLRAVDGGKK